jgi:hypothetical protein
MQRFQKIECGLPSKDFVLQGLDKAPSSVRCGGEGRRVARFRTGSPWQANREAGARLTWRGRNFIEAFAAINHCDLVRATMVDLSARQSLQLLVGGAPTGDPFRFYHFVCEASAGSRMQVGENAVTLRTGDLWRLYGDNLPVIVHGGRKGGIYMELVLARRHAGWDAGLMAEDQNCGGRENNSRAAA